MPPRPSGGADIRGFFKPGPASSHAPAPAPASAPATSSPLSSPSLPSQNTPPFADPLPSSPRTPSPSAARPARPPRKDVIRGSDEEDDDSDSSLESLSNIYGRPHARADPTRTPQAKRIASGRTHSPLTLQQRRPTGPRHARKPSPPKHKFDMKALISHSRQNDKADESRRLATRALDIPSDDDDNNESLSRDDSGNEKSPSDLHRAARQLLGNDDHHEGGDEETRLGEDRVVRAIDRTRAQVTQRRFYFFDPDAPLLLRPASQPFPSDEADGVWAFLGNGSQLEREQAFVNGLPHTFVLRGQQLPDAVLAWVLDEVVLERNPQLQAQYVNLIALTGDAVKRLVDPKRVYQMLGALGGPAYSEGNVKPATAKPEVEGAYRGREWSGVATYLRLLVRIAPNLSNDARVSAIQLLLRMSLDGVVCTALRTEHIAATRALVESLPTAANQWNDSCGVICRYIHAILPDDNAVARSVVVLTGLPKASLKLCDLRRRAAACALFDDVPGPFGRGGDEDAKASDLGLYSAPSLDTFLDRLAKPDLAIEDPSSADYPRVRALVSLLDVAIGSGAQLRTDNALSASEEATGPLPKRSPISTPTTNKKPHPFASAGAARLAADPHTRDHDEAIDKLAAALRSSRDRIVDGGGGPGAIIRKDVRTLLDIVVKRLELSARSRPPPRKGIFEDAVAGIELEQEKAREQQKQVGKQSDFMRSWAAPPS